MKLGFDKILIFFGITISCLFIAFGAILIFTPLFSYIPVEMKKIAGVVLLAYGLIRIIAHINKLNDNNHEAE